MKLRLFYDYNFDGGSPDPTMWTGYGSTPQKLPSVGGNTLKGAASGAALGTSIVPGWGTAIGGLVGAAAGLISGTGQRNQAKRMMANNPYPTQVIPQEALENQQIARQMANEGLPSQIYQNSLKNIQRQQTSAMRSATDRRAGLGLIGSIQQGTNDAQAQLDAANAAARMQNQKGLMGVNNQVAGWRQQAFDWNQKNRYNQQYQYSMNLLSAGNQNIVHGIDSGVAGLMYLGDGMRGRNRFSDSTSSVYNG